MNKGSRLLNFSIIGIGGVLLLLILASGTGIPGINGTGEKKDSVTCDVEITRSAIAGRATISSTSCRAQRECSIFDELSPFGFFSTKGEVLFIADGKTASKSFDVNILSWSETKSLTLCVSKSTRQGVVRTVDSQGNKFDEKGVSW